MSFDPQAYSQIISYVPAEYRQAFSRFCDATLLDPVTPEEKKQIFAIVEKLLTHCVRPHIRWYQFRQRVYVARVQAICRRLALGGKGPNMVSWAKLNGEISQSQYGSPAMRALDSACRCIHYAQDERLLRAIVSLFLGTLVQLAHVLGERKAAGLLAAKGRGLAAKSVAEDMQRAQMRNIALAFNQAVAASRSAVS